MNASFTADGVTVESNTDTTDQIRESFPAPKEEAAPVVEEQAGAADGEEPAVEAKAAPVNETAEQKATRERDEQGRFAKGKDAQKRIDHLTWEREEAKRETARERDRAVDLERRLAALESGKPQARTAPQAPRVVDPRDPEPQEADFEHDYNGYLTAHTRWAVRDENRQIDAQRSQREQQARHSQETDAVVKSYGEKIAAASTPEQDFIDTLSPEVASLTPSSLLSPGERPGPLNALAEHVMRSPHTVLLLRHLSAHPDSLRRFDALHPSAFTAVFADLVSDARLGAASSAAAPVAPKISQAKPPVKAVTASPVAGDTPPGDDDDDEAHRAYWNRREQSQRRRTR